MKKIRFIARLDIKGPNVIKGIQFECLRVVGKPDEMTKHYYEQGADELVYIDTVANLYQRDNLVHIVDKASESIFIPFTVGGGVRTIDNIRELLQAGADKVAINTEATKNMQLVSEAVKVFGSQCIVVSIEAKRVGPGRWEAYVDNGRQSTGLDAVEWAKKVEALGAGEILLTSVDMDGTERGFDLELIKAVSDAVSISLIVSGGAGNSSDVSECVSLGNVDGVACGSMLHYNKYHIDEIKEELAKKGISVRRDPNVKKVNTNPYQQYDITNYNKFTLNQLQGDREKIGSEEAKIFNIRTKKCEDDHDYEIGIINCGINNVKSVLKAFERIEKKAKIINTSSEILSSKYLVLPGVGAFEYGMDKLDKLGLIKPLKEKVQAGTPILGICLGMQLLFSESEEFGLHKGLDIIPGRVISFKSSDEIKVKGYKVPHIGWNKIKYPSFVDDAFNWDNTILKETELDSSVYFVHSFYPVPDNSKDVIATAECGGQEFCAVVKHGNITATQFHPEKSGEIGIKMVERFCRKIAQDCIR
ncbi:MAG: imidazole glycerol phosphate synthase subunit HisH [Candidatus Omnitrophota bacterium]